MLIQPKLFLITLISFGLYYIFSFSIDDSKIVCSNEDYHGTYIGAGFINGYDIAHQFSN